MKRLTWAILILSPGLASPVFAHELATHGALTYQAYDRSILKADLSNPQDPQFVEKVLGLDIQGNPRNPFGSDYYDISGERTERRSANDFENAIIVRELENLGVNQLSLPGWLLRGAIREDDWTVSTSRGARFSRKTRRTTPIPILPTVPSITFSIRFTIFR